MLEVLGRSVRVGLIAQGEHRGTVGGTDELGGSLVTCAGAGGDVARRDDDHRLFHRLFRTAASGDEDRDEGHDDHRRGPTGFDASERLTGFQKEHPL
jgi:hypothetical protein